MNKRQLATCGAVFPALLLLAACGGPTTLTLPDGTVAYRIDCGGAVGGMNYCFEKAGKSCGADGYLIVTREGQTISNSSATSTERIARVRENQADQNSIFVTCGS